MTGPEDRRPADGRVEDGRADDARDLLAAYALDAVDDFERRAVERLLDRDPRARAELAAFRATAARLGGAVAVPPPDRVREDVLAALGRTAQDAPAAPGSTDLGHGAGAADRAGGAARPAARRAPRRGLVLAAAAAAVLAVAVPSGIAWDQHGRAVQAEAEADRLAAALADPGAQVLRAAVTGGGQATAVLSGDDGVLLLDDVATLPAGRVYQLWTMREGTPRPAGLLRPQDGDVRALAEDYRPGDGLAVSVEPAGGSAVPTTEPVVVLLPG